MTVNLIQVISIDFVILNFCYYKITFSAWHTFMLACLYDYVCMLLFNVFDGFFVYCGLSLFSFK